MFIRDVWQESAPSPDGDSAPGSGSGMESQDQPSTSPSLLSDDTVITLANGETATYAEIKNSHIRAADLNRDYTVKTQEAADMKRQADEATAEAAAVRAEALNDVTRASELRDAVQQDLVWYNTHDQSQWAGYSPEVDKAMGIGTTPQAPASAAVTSDPRDAEITALKTRLEKIEGTQVKTANEQAVDRALDAIESTAGSFGHELVTSKLLLKSVQAHQAQNNGALPDASQIALYSKELQDELVNMGVPVPRGEVSANGSSKARPTGDVAAQVDPAWKDFNMKKDRPKVEDALAKILRDKQDARS